MNKYIIGIAVILVSLLVVGVALSSLSGKGSKTTATSIQWGNDINKSMQEAKNTKKSIFMDFHTDGCSYCVEMDKETFTDPQVIEKLTQNYVLLKVDVDENPDLSLKYRAYSLPTMVIVDSSGNEIKRIIGYQTPEQLLGKI